MRAATFNILNGRSLDDGLVEPVRLADAVRTLDADVLALQEVDRGQPRSHFCDQTAVAAEAMGAVDHRFVAVISGTPGEKWAAATPREPGDTPAYGIALLSRYPVIRWRVLDLPRIRVPFPLLIRGSRRLVVMHEEPRAAVIADLDTPFGMVTVAGTHLSFVPGWNAVQLRRIRRALADATGPVILMGDLNMPAPTPSRITGFRSLIARPTFPGSSPNQQLDHILLRGELGEPRRGAAPRLRLSDHRALVVDLVIAGGRPDRAEYPGS